MLEYVARNHLCQHLVNQGDPSTCTVACFDYFLILSRLDYGNGLCARSCNTSVTGYRERKGKACLNLGFCHRVIKKGKEHNAERWKLMKVGENVTWSPLSCQ